MTTILENFQQITDRIRDLCQSRHRPCSERVAAYTLRAVALDQTNNFDFETGLTPAQLKTLVEIAAERIMEANNPAMETIKMQAAYDGITVLTTHEVHEQELEHDKQTERLAEKVLEFWSRLKSDSQLPTMYSLLYDLMANNSGSDDDPATSRLDRQSEREISQALQSALPKSRILALGQVSIDQRRQHLASLINIVLGIRLLNRYLGKGGLALPDVPDRLSTISAVLVQDLKSELDQVQVQINQYKTLIELEFRKPGTISSSLQRLQDEHRNRLQLQAFLQDLFHQADQVSNLILNAIQTFDDEMATLKSKVHSRQSVPRQQILPAFDAIGRLWRALQQEGRRLTAKRTTLQELLKFKSNFTSGVMSEDLSLLQDSALLHSLRAYEKSAEIRPDSSSSASNHQIEILPGEQAVGMSRSSLGLHGYCPWTIAERAGLLMNGDLSLGLVKYKGVPYACVDQAALDQFIHHPDTIMAAVHERVRQAPELIHLLDLHGYYPNVQGLQETKRQDVSTYGESNATCDAGTDMGDGTDLYPPEDEPAQRASNMQMWNLWNIRRQALKLVKLRKMSTHSTQTTKTYSKRASETQTYLPKDEGTQSATNKSVNTVTRRRYMTGLRGSQNNVKIVTLTM